MFPIFIPVLHQHILRQIKEKYHIVLNIIECKLGMKRLLIMITNSYTFCLDGLKKKPTQFLSVIFVLLYDFHSVTITDKKSYTTPLHCTRVMILFSHSSHYIHTPINHRKKPNFIDQIGWDKSFITIDIFDIDINH